MGISIEFKNMEFRIGDNNVRVLIGEDERLNWEYVRRNLAEWMEWLQERMWSWCERPSHWRNAWWVVREWDMITLSCQDPQFDPWCRCESRWCDWQWHAPWWNENALGYDESWMSGRDSERELQLQSCLQRLAWLSPEGIRSSLEIRESRGSEV